MKTCMSLAILIIVAASVDAYAEDTDAKQYLNDLMATKQSILVQVNQPRRRLVCETNMPTGGSTELMIIGADEPAWGRRYCYYVTEDNWVKIPQSGRVSKSEITSASDLKWLEENVVSLPGGKVLGSIAEYHNCGSADITESLSFQLSATEGHSVSKSRTVSAGNSRSINAGFSYMGANVGTNFSFSNSISTSNSQQESSSSTVSRGNTVSVHVKAHLSGRVEMWITESTIEVPFTATVVVDGPLQPNVSGVSKASDLLTEAERTLEFSGRVRITGVSHFRMRNVDLPECKSDTGVSIEYDQIELPLSPSSKLTFMGDLKTIQQILTTKPMEAGDGSEIGPADGTSYQIVSSIEVIKAALECGFNDIGLPQPGAFTQETRLWMTYVNGTKVAQWSEVVDIFKECRAP